MVLDKKTALYDRDEKGELVPKEVIVEVDEDDELQMEYEGEKILVVPIPRGKIKKIFSKISDKDEEEKDLDGDIILEHCSSPKFDKKEIEHMKPALSTVIVNTIFRESGIRVGANKRKAILETEDDFAKN